MVRLEYLRDLHEHPACKQVIGVDELPSLYSRRYWGEVELRIRKKYGCNLSAYILYAHHFQGKSVYEIAENELGKPRQVVSGLVKMLHLPMRDDGEKFTPRTAERISKANTGRHLSVETRRKLSQHQLDGRALPEEWIVGFYTKKCLGGYYLGWLFDVSADAIYHCLERNGIPRRDKRTASLGKKSPKRRLSYEEYYGVERALKIKDKMSEAQRARWRRVGG